MTSSSLLGWSSRLGNQLFGPDPKLEFSKQGHGVDLLTGESIPIDDPYWHQYLTLFDSPSDVVLLLPSPTLFRALSRSPQNLLTLVTYLSTSLLRLLSTPGFPRPLQGEHDDAREAINAVRVLSRVVPLLMAPQGIDREGSRRWEEIEERLFWMRERVERAEEEKKGEVETREEEDGEGNFVLDDSDDEEATATDPLSTPAPAAAVPQQTEEEFLPPLAERLLSALVDLLFVPGFTVPDTLRRDGSTVNYAIWEPGIASPPPPSPPPPTPHLLLLNRLAILRLLTLLISLPSLLTPPSLFPVLPNRWRDALVSARSIRGQDRNVVLCLLCSVVNTAFAPSSSSASNPSGGANEGFREKAQRLATEAARKAPAASGFLAEGPVMEDYGTTKERLRTASVQFLAVVLAQHALAEEVVSTSPSSSAAASEMKEKEKGKGEENLFTFYLSRLHRPSDLSFLLSGVLSLLSSALSPPSSSSSLLPFSLPLSLSPSPAAQADSPGLANEALVVLWRLIEVDRKFASWVGRVERAEEGKAERGGRNRLVETVVSVVAAMGRWRGDETQQGLLRLSTFLLQSLTALIASYSPPHSSPAHETAAALLSTPLGPGLIGEGLWGVVRGMCEVQGVWVDGGEGREGRGANEEVGEKGVSAVEFLVITLHALLLPSPAPSSSSSRAPAPLTHLYPSLLLSLSNLSPFIRNLGEQASTRLVRVWLAFSAPSWVLMEDGNPRLVYYLLETFNSLLSSPPAPSSSPSLPPSSQHSPPPSLLSNPHLLHALLLTLKRFELLNSFTLSTGVAEARRLRAARRARQTGTGGAGLGGIPEDGEVAPSPRIGAEGVSEKSLGKRRERTLSTSSASFADLSLSASSSPSPSPSLAASPQLGSGAELGRESLDIGRGGTDEAKPFVGKNGFVPTEDWVKSWKDGLPLTPLLSLLSYLSTSLPPSSHPPSSLLPLLTSLPPPLLTLLSTLPPPRSRPFVPSPSSTTWLSALLYGRVYLAHLEGVRDTVPVQLFAVASSSGGRTGGGGGGGVAEGLGKELERAGKTAVEVGGRVGGLAKGFLGGFGGGR